MKNFYFLLLFGFVHHTSAQSLTAEWAIGLSSSSIVQCNDMATDPDDNVVVVGLFVDLVDFDPSAEEFLLEANNTQDLFVAKYSASGELIWARAFGGTGNDSADGLAIDQLGRIHVTGSYDPPVNFSTAGGNASPGDQGGIDAFILSLDTDGNYLSVIGGGGDESDHGTALVTDEENNIYATGSYEGSSQFSGPGQSSAASFFPYGMKDVFMVKIGSDLLVEWDDQFGGINSNDVPTSITLDSQNNIFIGGTFSATCHFDPSSGNNLAQFQSTGFNDYFITKRDNLGEYLWVKTFGGSNDEKVNDIEIDTFDNIYATGYFENTVDFDPDPEYEAVLYTGVPGNGKRTFIQKLDANGEYIWVYQLESATRNEGNALVLSQTAGVYIGGFFFDSADFNPGPQTYTVSSVASTSDVYLLNLTDAGTFVDVLTFGGDNTDQDYALAIDAQSAVYAAGKFASAFDIDDNPDVSLTGEGIQSGFLGRFYSCVPNYSTEEVHACTPYTWLDGNTYSSSTNEPEFVIAGGSENGCDSIVNLNLTIEQLFDLEIIELANQELQAQTTGVSYQWLDCDDGFSAIAGETDQNFMPLETGNYAVELSNENCTEVSECFQFSLVGVDEAEISDFYIYPNPGNGILNVLSQEQTIQSIRIYTSIGTLVFEEAKMATSHAVVQLIFPAGVYVVEVIGERGKCFERCVVE